MELLEDYFAGAETAKRTSRIAEIAMLSRGSQRAGHLLCRIASTRKGKSNVDRNLRRCIHKAGVTLDLDVELVKTTIKVKKPKLGIKSVYWPCFSLRSWVSTLATSFSPIMFGGFDVEEEHNWRRLFSWFWATYKGFDGGHPIYEMPDLDLSLCIPIMTHGDEGRGLCSQAFMVQSFQFVISHLGPFTTNTSGHSFTSRMLFTCISSKLYDGEKTLRDINTEWAKQLHSLFHEGVQVGGKTIRLVWIAGKGDWPYLRKAFNLETGFTSKRVCHLCTGEEWYRFDSDAAWRGPGGRPGPSPFKSDGNVFSIVPGCTPERIKPDLVHSFHIGFGADLAASIIVWLARLDKFGRLAFDERLRVAYSMFQEYCHEQKRYNSCDEWCLKKMGMTSSSDFPTSLGGKGHDTAVVCRWLEKLLMDMECETPEMETMRYTIQCVNMFFDILYSNGIFLPANDALQAQEYAMRVCEGYSQLASMAHGTGQKLFKLRPKLHMLYEIALQLHPHGPYVLSPVATCCWTDEDYIGRVSKVVRSCHGASQSIGAMRKTLGMYRLQFTRNAAKKHSASAR
ncbi:unnamed protein product [Cladocopium goreaui]|uniref:Uncharacterized protein n=1 Tax=Cladocopium goreaui TaxID=2562237 RepID=A0A9P1FH45_9DINO|nr:unnamed protein product [Cladocopium goreaui]